MRDNVSEIVSADLDFHGLTFTVACYYRPPNNKSVDDIISWYEKQTNPNIIILGDFNLPAID